MDRPIVSRHPDTSSVASRRSASALSFINSSRVQRRVGRTATSLAKATPAASGSTAKKSPIDKEAAATLRQIGGALVARLGSSEGALSPGEQAELRRVLVFVRSVAAKIKEQAQS